MNGYWHAKNFFKDVQPWGKHISCAKFEAVLPYNIDLLAETYIPMCNLIKFDPSMIDGQVIASYSPQKTQELFAQDVACKQRSNHAINFSCIFPFPINQKRRFLSVNSVRYHPQEDEIVLIYKPLMVKDMPLPKNWVEMYTFSVNYFKRLDDERTLFTEVHLFMLGGWATSRTMQKFIVMERAKELLYRSIDVMKKAAQGKMVPKPDDPLYQCLLDCDIANRRLPKFSKTTIDASSLAEHGALHSVQSAQNLK